jgi:hypothetical protein
MVGVSPIVLLITLTVTLVKNVCIAFTQYLSMRSPSVRRRAQVYKQPCIIACSHRLRVNVSKNSFTFFKLSLSGRKHFINLRNCDHKLLTFSCRFCNA